MNNIYPEEIGFVTTNHKLAKQVFEDGIGLKLLFKNATSRLYRLNDQTELNVWTDGMEHPLSQAYISFASDKETILRTARVVKNWGDGVNLKRIKTDEEETFLFLTINFPDGSDLSLSNQYWNGNG